MARKKFFIPPSPAASPALPFGADKPWLAPMAGYSDLPFRMLCRELGAACCVTEMVSAKGLVYKSPGTGELLLSQAADQPLVVQLFGDDPDCMGQAARLLSEAGYAWFDCNLGCPARKVLKQNAGASLLEDAPRVLAIARAMIGAIRETGGGGVGFKLRLGMDEKHMADADLPLRLQDAGAAWITLHPRFAKQGYSGQAQWKYIGRLAENLEIPLLASGDLLTAAAGMDCLAQTKAAGLMYARGALRNPFIFAQHMALARGRPMPALSHAGLRDIICRHMKLARELAADDRAIYKMRSIVPRYVRDLPGTRNLRLQLCQCDDWDGLLEILDAFMAAAK